MKGKNSDLSNSSLENIMVWVMVKLITYRWCNDLVMHLLTFKTNIAPLCITLHLVYNVHTLVGLARDGKGLCK